jgi:two-component system phosphate regulon response regulator PhoB
VGNPLALIVEDDPDIGNVFLRTMEAAGFQVELIDSGDKAVAWLATKVPDVIVLDIRLPYISGVEILRQVRGDPRLAETPVIIATAYPKSAALLQEYADRVLIKPVSLRQLRDLAIQLCSQDE